MTDSQNSISSRVVVWQKSHKRVVRTTWLVALYSCKEVVIPGGDVGEAVVIFWEN